MLIQALLLQFLADVTLWKGWEVTELQDQCPFWMPTAQECTVPANFTLDDLVCLFFEARSITKQNRSCLFMARRCLNLMHGAPANIELVKFIKCPWGQIFACHPRQILISVKLTQLQICCLQNYKDNKNITKLKWESLKAAVDVMPNRKDVFACK